MNTTALNKKVFLRANDCLLVLNAPESYIAKLAPLPEGVVLDTDADEDKQYDGVHFFARTQEDVRTFAPVVLRYLKHDAMLWTFWPKRTSKVPTDLTRDVGWEPFEAAGLTRVASISVDEVWSGLRWRPVAR